MIADVMTAVESIQYWKLSIAKWEKHLEEGWNQTTCEEGLALCEGALELQYDALRRAVWMAN